MGIEYACEKMYQTLDTLTGGIDPLPDRLEGAYIHSFMSALSDAEGGGYLPPTLLAEMDSIQERLNSEEPVSTGDGTLRATLEGMDVKEMQDVAHDMLRVALAVFQVGLAAGVEVWWAGE